MLFLTAAGSTQPDYVALGMVLVLALFVAVKAVRKYLSRKHAAEVRISLVPGDDTAQNVLANLITIFLGISVAFNMTADKFLRLDTLLIMGVGMVVIFAIISVIIGATLLINFLFSE